MHGGIVRLLSPQGTRLNSFSVNFHPLPNSDKPFLPPSPQWRICPRSLCPPLTSFFDCSLSCRQHAAYANTHSFIPETPPLNECNLKWGHTCTHLQRGHGNMHVYNQRICIPLWRAVTQTSNADHFKRADIQAQLMFQMILSKCLHIYFNQAGGRQQTQHKSGGVADSLGLLVIFQKRFLCNVQLVPKKDGLLMFGAKLNCTHIVL